MNKFKQTLLSNKHTQTRTHTHALSFNDIITHLVFIAHTLSLFVNLKPNSEVLPEEYISCIIDAHRYG